MRKALILAAASLPLAFGLKAPGRLPGDNPPPRAMLLQPPPVPSPGIPGPTCATKRRL